MQYTRKLTRYITSASKSLRLFFLFFFKNLLLRRRYGFGPTCNSNILTHPCLMPPGITCAEFEVLGGRSSSSSIICWWEEGYAPARSQLAFLFYFVGLLLPNEVSPSPEIATSPSGSGRRENELLLLPLLVSLPPPRSSSRLEHVLMVTWPTRETRLHRPASRDDAIYEQNYNYNTNFHSLFIYLYIYLLI